MRNLSNTNLTVNKTVLVLVELIEKVFWSAITMCARQAIVCAKIAAAKSIENIDVRS